MKSDWRTVSRQAPCPICQKPDWCGVSTDGVWCICMRMESGRRTKNGGWMHRTGSAAAPFEPRRLPPPQDRKLSNPAAYHAALRRPEDWYMTDGLALTLGVDVYELDRLEPAYDPVNQAFAFPMRDGKGNVVGVRLRSMDGSNKWAVRGSNVGAFVPSGEFTGRELVICEGPTDTAAALSLGLPAIGRPSCSGAVEIIRETCSRLRISLVTIIADNDAPKRRPDGSLWRPGLAGASDLGRGLRRQFRIVVPPAKDIRAWLHDGATPAMFRCLADAAQRRFA